MCSSKLLALLCGLVLALAGVCAYLGFRLSSVGAAAPAGLAELLEDPAVRERVVGELVATTEGVFDSHRDPEVARVLQPKLQGREYANTLVSSNSSGMREKEYELPKPDGTLRIVFLGDSFVFGTGVAPDQRMGAHLEELLRERAPGFEGVIECLHLGISSWNLVSECAFLRRQLGQMRPDLVVHLTVSNDLDDNNGVRGFGEAAYFDPRHPEWADSQIRHRHPTNAFHIEADNHLTDGLDYESRERYREARERIDRLAAEVERQGGRYLLMFHWGDQLPVAHLELAANLRPNQVVCLDPEFRKDPRTWNSPEDTHWNPRAHARIARLVYGLALERDLLPRLDLEPWPEAVAEIAALHEPGLAVARDVDSYLRRVLNEAPIGPRLDLRSLDARTAAMVNGGIIRDCFVQPYASVILRSRGGRILRIHGESLDRPELDGALVRVFADELPVGELELRAGTPLRAELTLPAAISERRFASIRFLASDYVYNRPGRQDCLSFRLLGVEIDS